MKLQLETCDKGHFHCGSGHRHGDRIAPTRPCHHRTNPHLQWLSGPAHHGADGARQTRGIGLYAHRGKNHVQQTVEHQHDYRKRAHRPQTTRTGAPTQTRWLH